jgi:hypothetical protein
MAQRGNVSGFKYRLGTKYFHHDDQECGGSADLILSELGACQPKQAKHCGRRKIGSGVEGSGQCDEKFSGKPGCQEPPESRPLAALGAAPGDE